ncbi:DUF4124 domain-containing protein [Alteromonas sp. ASW11-130]|uniref:DUF4124 domain-containing protein n=1 Tax=Alteromonas sp. ASW11-130 TaxID=3015775 RepID=UPI0022419760|nr:DUF4124 domain-containing protein [Alteromonas sp. ASW11-130]MCW8091727.1 DUF4124 domain-containing protein [Alteromonas sp. ASW11-130]
MYRRINWTVLVTLFVFSSASADTLYKVVQEDGTILYTDEPQQDAEKVELDETTQNAVPTLTTQSGQKPTLKSMQKVRPRVQISILSPAPEATIRNNQGHVLVKANATPNVSGRYQLWFDGEAVKTNQTGQFSLNNVNRGAHEYQVKFIDNKGKTLASSSLQTLYLHQASALINNKRQ